MKDNGRPPSAESESRAKLSLGISSEAIYAMVGRALRTHCTRGETLLDVGCGSGRLRSSIGTMFDRYVGVDVVRYVDFPREAEFIRADLDQCSISLPDGFADVVAAVEVIEHLDNPRGFMRELVRLAKDGGWVMITTPNQLSVLSLLTLIVKHRFSAFQDVHYPTHRTALLEVDLRRIATECRLESVNVMFSHQGRMVLTPWHYPFFLARCFPRALSDNILLIGRKPAT